MTCFQDFGFIPFPKNLSNTAMASSDSNNSIRLVSDGDISSECSSGGDYGIVNMGANLPYQDEPLTISDQTFNFEKGRDGIPRDFLEARSENTIAVADWYV